jgi:hypothetical protein
MGYSIASFKTAFFNIYYKEVCKSSFRIENLGLLKKNLEHKKTMKSPWNHPTKLSILTIFNMLKNEFYFHINFIRLISFGILLHYSVETRINCNSKVFFLLIVVTFVHN